MQGVGMNVTVKYTDTDIIKNEWGWWNVLYSNVPIRYISIIFVDCFKQTIAVNKEKYIFPTWF